MCLPVLAFVRKRNKDMEKSKGECQKRGGKKTPEWSKKRGAKGLFREVIWQQKASIVSVQSVRKMFTGLHLEWG